MVLLKWPFPHPIIPCVFYLGLLPYIFLNRLRVQVYTGNRNSPPSISCNTLTDPISCNTMTVTLWYRTPKFSFTSHLYVFSNELLSGVTFWKFFHSMDSLSWQNPGSCLSIKLAAGLLQISQLLLRCLKHRNVLTSLQHMSEVVLAETANTTQS